jgi:Planctomycete cytochrome C
MSLEPGSESAVPRLLSARAYFAWVAVATLAVFAIFAVFRPSLANALKQTLGIEKSPPQSPQSFYAVRVSPILEEHCANCHGARRQKSKLRLDTLAAALRGGKHGPVIQPGNVRDSVLAQRIELPPRDKGAMPPSSQPPLSPDDATVIRLWIDAGASGTLPVTYFKSAPPAVAHVVIPEVDPAAVAAARAPTTAALRSLQRRFADVIDYESRGSARLELDASLLGRAFGDNELAAFAPLGESIVRADLSGTAIGEASAGVLGGMKNLRVLRMMDVPIGPAMASQLSALRNQGTRVYVDGVDEQR